MFSKNHIFMRVFILPFCSLLLFFMTCLPVATAEKTGAATPPSQPAEGPGGAQYSYAKVRKNRYGQGATEYWIFEPDSPAPQSAPVIVFMHGWSAMNPMAYGAWIEHLVRRGNLVIYPRYQADVRTPVPEFLDNAVAALKDAFKELESGSHVHPQLDKVAVVGHSMGGMISPDIAAGAASAGLPAFKAVMTVEPGKSWIKARRIAYNFSDLSRLPAETLLLCVAGEEDRLAKDIDAKRICKETTSISGANKDYIVLFTDNHGSPPLRASHHAPLALNKDYDSGERRTQLAGPNGGERMKMNGFLRERLKERIQEQYGQELPQVDTPADIPPEMTINALDYYGLWKLFDGLTDAAFYGKNREYALGNTPQQRFMGKWSDGVPVKELKVE